MHGQTVVIHVKPIPVLLRNPRLPVTLFLALFFATKHLRSHINLHQTTASCYHFGSLSHTFSELCSPSHTFSMNASTIMCLHVALLWRGLLLSLKLWLGFLNRRWLHFLRVFRRANSPIRLTWGLQQVDSPSERWRKPVARNHCKILQALADQGILPQCEGLDIRKSLSNWDADPCSSPATIQSNGGSPAQVSWNGFKSRKKVKNHKESRINLQLMNKLLMRNHLRWWKHVETLQFMEYSLYQDVVQRHHKFFAVWQSSQVYDENWSCSLNFL